MSVIVIKVHNGYFFKGLKQLVANSGKTTFIDATSGASYELIVQQLGHAPEQILIEKRANNLLVSFEDKTQIDLVIRDFFKYEDSQLVGKDSYNQYYSYLPVYDEYDTFFGKEIWTDSHQANEAYLVELGSYAKVTPWMLEAQSQPLGNMLKPALLSLGAGALVLYGIENWRIDNDTSSNKPNSNNITQVPSYDKDAIVDIDSGKNQVANTANLGTGVGVTMKATDNKGKAKTNITYELLDDANGLFDINKFTGKVVVAKSLSDKSGTQSITIKATDVDGKSKETKVTIDIKGNKNTNDNDKNTSDVSAKKKYQAVDEIQASDVLQSNEQLDDLMRVLNLQKTTQKSVESVMTTDEVVQHQTTNTTSKLNTTNTTALSAGELKSSSSLLAHHVDGNLVHEEAVNQYTMF